VTEEGVSTTDEMPDEFSSRHLRNRVLQLLGLVLLVIVVISAVPGLADLRTRFVHAEPGWLVLAAFCELLSALSYVAVFRGVFCPRMGLRMSYQIGISEQAANSLLPSGGAGGLALGAWALRRGGVPTAHIARRSVAFFLLTSSANVSALIVFGFLLGIGALGQKEPATLTFLPAAIALLAVLGVLFLARVPSARPTESSTADKITEASPSGRLATLRRGALTVIADGTHDALELLQTRNVTVIAGIVGYLAFDIAMLAACFAAFGRVPPLAVLVIAYVIGQLGGLIPIPGGVGGVDIGLIGTFVVYGTPVAVATVAVLAYRVFLLWIPAILGSLAFVNLRRTLKRADQPALVCSPLADLATAGLPVVTIQRPPDT
jgi:uncharacterized protein (TIRG00374 family)